MSAEILSSAGHVVDNVEVVIRDDEFRPLPTGSVGRISVCTPTAFTGYWRDPVATRQTLRDGWVVMGDIGYFDSAGYLHVLGRQADQVFKGSRYLNPREIEEVAHDNQAVKEACLVQHSDSAVLVVSLRSNWRDSDPHDVVNEIEWELSSRLAPDIMPDNIRVIDVMPRSFLNKILRREVRAILDNFTLSESSAID